MKTGGIIKIIVGGVVAILLIALMLGIFLGNGVGKSIINVGEIVIRDEDDDSTPVDQTATFDAGDISSIRVQWLAGSVSVVQGTGDAVVIRETSTGSLGDDERMRYTLENGELSILYRANLSTNWATGIGTDLGKKLIVEVPASLAGSLDQLRIETVSASATVEAVSAREIKLETVSGNHELTGITCEKLSASGVSGAFRLTDITCSELEMDSVSGEMTVEGTFDEIDVDTTSGTIELRCTAAPRKIEADSISGDFTVLLPADVGFTAHLDTVSGEISSDFACITSGKRLVCGDGTCEYDFETTSGDVRLRVLA